LAFQFPAQADCGWICDLKALLAKAVERGVVNVG
jgi:hypothetical protein